MLAAALLASVYAGQATAANNVYPNLNAFWECEDESAVGEKFCQTDNSDLTVFREASLSFTAKAWIQQALNDFHNNTDLTVTYQNPPIYVGGAETDVIYQVDPNGLPPTALAATWCDNAISASTCDQHYVRAASNSSVDDVVACHETGHAVGLTHGENADPAVSNSLDQTLGCMKTPYSNASRVLGYENAANINSMY